MLSDEFPEMEAYSPEHFGGTASHLMIYTEDCDKMHKQAVEAGCTETQAPKDQFYGDRCVVSPSNDLCLISLYSP